MPTGPAHYRREAVFYDDEGEERAITLAPCRCLLGEDQDDERIYAAEYRPGTCTWNTPTARSADLLRPPPEIAYALRTALLSDVHRWIEA